MKKSQSFYRPCIIYPFVHGPQIRCTVHDKHYTYIVIYFSYRLTSETKDFLVSKVGLQVIYPSVKCSFPTFVFRAAFAVQQSSDIFFSKPCVNPAQILLFLRTRRSENDSQQHFSYLHTLDQQYLTIKRSAHLNHPTDSLSNNTDLNQQKYTRDILHVSSFRRNGIISTSKPCTCVKRYMVTVLRMFKSHFD